MKREFLGLYDLVQILTLPPTSFETLAKVLNLSVLSPPIIKEMVLC